MTEEREADEDPGQGGGVSHTPIWNLGERQRRAERAARSRRPSPCRRCLELMAAVTMMAGKGG